MLIQGIATVPSLFGEIFEFSCPKIKNVAFRFIVPALKVSYGFVLQAWFISMFIASILIGHGGLPLISISWYIKLISSIFYSVYRYKYGSQDFTTRIRTSSCCIFCFICIPHFSSNNIPPYFFLDPDMLPITYPTAFPSDQPIIPLPPGPVKFPSLLPKYPPSLALSHVS